MNLLVRRIDRLAEAQPFSVLDPSRIGRGLTPRQRNVAYTSLWAGVFVALIAARGVGDTHPGQYLPFWQNACKAGSTRACNYAADLTLIYCNNGSGWACNEVGILRTERNRKIGDWGCNGISGQMRKFRRHHDEGPARHTQNRVRVTPARFLVGSTGVLPRSE